jgi:hypothetical protein
MKPNGTPKRRNETRTKRKRHKQHKVETETKPERTDETKNGNGNETGETFQGRKPEKEGGKVPTFPSFLPSNIPVFRSFPVCLRAIIKTIFPPLRYVSPHFEKKVKKYL